MAIQGCSLKETEQFIEVVSKCKQRLIDDKEYLREVLEQGPAYNCIKKYFENFVKFMRYQEEVNISCVYRVRKCKGEIPYLTKQELIYPPPNIEHEDRMNNISSRVLYTAFHEFTAMAETRIDKSFIDSYFQLTRFSIEKPFTVFRLGLFSEIHLNSPRDSEYTKDTMINYFGSQGHDGTMMGYSALECAMADVLYDSGDKYHVLSSILADAIFSMVPSVQAIMYPSMQNRYGVNLAFRKDFADSMKIEYSCLNILKNVYANGFYKYHTLAECIEFNDDKNFSFVDITEPYTNKIRR
ncbi:hypothetical protein CGJ47_23700 [Vibrio parahaemolyticus]|uniref:RES family NAD+ phosphorylase n=1 Tax=Vibrio parahaemolyticus TaxID=670 RepID=UPI0011202C49|nr:RES family NAD+ phosphorylase [Vibrio parahaemolyticus]TOE18720.1 hypothetical protein CGJ47_23700 [Vibrio parahaemolyticus]